MQMQAADTAVHSPAQVLAANAMPGVPPTPEQIDAMVQDYLDKKNHVDGLADAVDDLKKNLIRLVDVFGVPAPRTEQAYRLEGRRAALTVTRGSTVTIEDAKVVQLSEYFTRSGRAHLFAKLFVPRSKWEMVPGAEHTLKAMEMPKRVYEKVVSLYGMCRTVKTKAPVLKVDLVGAEPKAKKKSSAGKVVA